jgi:DNA-binding IclR family transcriptional regulator
MLDLLTQGGASTATGLSEHLPVSRQAITKHLQVLDRVGLIHGAAAGKERRYHVDEARLGEAVNQMSDVSAAWDKRLRRIRRMAEHIQRLTDEH